MTLATPTVRVGVDVTDVRGVRESIERFGDRYLDRIYTPHELASCTGHPDVVARSLAARFAAKEATFKVLRPHGVAPGWKDVEVHKDPRGWTELRLAGTAAELATAAHLQGLSLSLTHEGDTATAVVVATCTARTDQEGTT
jgi:holo-[acyl-carrier protein] synthase